MDVVKKYWRTRTNLEKGLICAVGFLCFIVIVLFVSFLVNNDTGICHSPQCVRSAVHLLDTIDSSVDPCEDFYNFACGTFIKNSALKNQPHALSSLKELTKNQLRSLVVDNTTTFPTSRTFRYQKKFYAACLNTQQIEKDKNDGLLDVLDSLIGGWPIIRSYGWNDRDFEWPQSVINARKAGVFFEFFFEISVYPETINNKSVLWIRPPKGQEVSKLELKNENIDHISQIAQVLGAQSVETPAALRRTMYFSEQLDKIIQKYYNKTLDDEDHDSMNITIKEIKITHLKIDWLSFLGEISGLNITADDTVVFTIDDYLEDFGNLLSKTPKKVLANYIGWTIIANSINFSSSSIRDKFMEIKHVEKTKKDSMDRTDFCYKLATEFFEGVAEAEYVRRYVTKDKKHYIRDMLRHLKHELMTSIEATSWMDEQSRSNEIKHVEKISEAIGWMDPVFDEDKFDEMMNYKNLTFPTYKFFDMARVVRKATVDNKFLYIARNWTYLDAILNSPMIDVNAFFVQPLDILILPAPILQYPIFDEDNPRYINYGSLGTVIGHELSHAFDGSLGEQTFWTNKTIERFEDVSQCLRTEYEEYETNNSSVAKNDSFAENLADFNGLHLAYRAYQNYVATFGREKGLPGVKYTPNQIFWLMTSTYMCFEPSNAAIDKFNKGHGIPSFRVAGRLRNSEEFAKDFNCPVGSKMNPKIKCKIYP